MDEIQDSQGKILGMFFGEKSQSKDTKVSLVFATIVFEESLSSKGLNQHLDAIEQIINSKDHLKRNVVDMSLSKFRSWRAQNSRYTHELPVIIHVNVSNLWENARSYLWQHLGTSEWTLEDGVKVSFRKIHQR